MPDKPTEHHSPIRMQIRGCDDGYTRALLAAPGAEPHELARIPTPPHASSPAVQAAFAALAAELLREAFSQAFPDLEISRVVTVPAGAPLDTPTH